MDRSVWIARFTVFSICFEGSRSEELKDFGETFYEERFDPMKRQRAIRANGIESFKDFRREQIDLNE